MYWVWAVRNGHRTSYERVVLLLNDVDDPRIEAPEVTPEDAGGFGLRADELVRGATPDGSPSAQQAQSRSFLVTFARNVVTSSVERSERLAEQVGTNGTGEAGG